MQRGQPAPAPARRERVNSHKSLSQKHISSSQKRDDAAGRRRALDDAKADAISSARTTARRGFRIRRPEPKPRATPGLAHERVDDVAPHNTTDRLQERARRLPPSFPNKCTGSARRPRRQQGLTSTPPHDASPAPRQSQKRNAATQHPTQHILLGTRGTSPTVESLKAPTRRLETSRPTTTLINMRGFL